MFCDNLIQLFNATEISWKIAFMWWKTRQNIGLTPLRSTVCHFVKKCCTCPSGSLLFFFLKGQRFRGLFIPSSLGLPENITNYYHLGWIIQFLLDILFLFFILKQLKCCWLCLGERGEMAERMTGGLSDILSSAVSNWVANCAMSKTNMQFSCSE